MPQLYKNTSIVRPFERGVVIATPEGPALVLSCPWNKRRRECEVRVRLAGGARARFYLHELSPSTKEQL